MHGSGSGSGVLGPEGYPTGRPDRRGVKWHPTPLLTRCILVVMGSLYGDHFQLGDNAENKSKVQNFPQLYIVLVLQLHAVAPIVSDCLFI